MTDIRLNYLTTTYGLFIDWLIDLLLERKITELEFANFVGSL